MNTFLIITFSFYFLIVVATNVEMMTKYGFKNMSNTLVVKGKEGLERKVALGLNIFNVIGLMSLLTVLSLI